MCLTERNFLADGNMGTEMQVVAVGLTEDFYFLCAISAPPKYIVLLKLVIK